MHENIITTTCSIIPPPDEYIYGFLPRFRSLPRFPSPEEGRDRLKAAPKFMKQSLSNVAFLGATLCHPELTRGAGDPLAATRILLGTLHKRLEETVEVGGHLAP